MSTLRCPGAERMRAAFPDEIRCVCGEKVEMWPDEFQLRCPSCGRTIEREAPPACIEWCAAARECVGERLYERYTRARRARGETDIKNKLLDEMRRYFGPDKKRIRHAERVAEVAGEILRAGGGHYGVVTAASILHDIGIPEAERKYGSAAPRLQEKEGPPVAREILERIGVDGEAVEEICGIIGRHHSPMKRESRNFSIVYDADTIVNLVEEGERGERVERACCGSFLTEEGSEIAARLLDGKGAMRLPKG